MTCSLILGVDPAKKNFTACLMDAEGRLLFPSEDFAMDRQGFDDLAGRVRPHQAGGAPLVVGIEASAALDDNLMAFVHSWRGQSPSPVTLIRLDAGQVARFTGPRPIRAKTDKADARRIAEFTRAYAARLDAFENDPQTLAMARLINERDQLVGDNVALKNRLQDRLVTAFPEFDQVFKEPCCPLALKVLRRIRTAARCARMRAGSLEKIRAAKAGHCVGAQRAADLIALAKTSIASAVDDIAADAVDHLCALIEFNLERIARIESQIKEFAQSEPRAAQPSAQEAQPGDAATLSIPRQIRLADSMPGVGVIGAATIILRCRGLERFTSAKALAAQLGLCPELRQSGSSQNHASLTHRGDRRTRSMLYLLTQIACNNDPSMAFHKWRHRQKGLTPKQAICACMNRYAKIMWTLVHTNSAYDPARMLMNVKTHHPDLWRKFAHEELTKLKNFYKGPKNHVQAA